MARKGSKTRKRRYNKAYYRLRKNYKKYTLLYEEREAMLNSHGYQMYDKILSWNQYKSAYEDMKNTREKEIEWGLRKSIGSINKAIVSDQAYELSEKQGYAIFDFLRENADKYGIDYDTRNINEFLMKIREGSWLREDAKIWDIITDFREQYLEQHKDDPDAKAALYGVYNPETRKYEGGLVSQTFFGSP